MGTVVKFLSEKYGNYNDTYYVKDYTAFISTLQQRVVESLTQDVNLGVVDGVIIENNFKGDFSTINCAIVESNYYGTHLYKIIKRVFIRRNLWRLTMVKDMVSAKYENILDSKVLATRLGLDRNSYNPLLFMEEEMTLSQIKTSQVLLGEKPNLKSYGFLLFFNRDAMSGTSETEIKWESQANLDDMEYDEEYDNIGEVPLIGTYTVKEERESIVTFNDMGVKWYTGGDFENFGYEFTIVDGEVTNEYAYEKGGIYLPFTIERKSYSGGMFPHPDTDELIEAGEKGYTEISNPKPVENGDTLYNRLGKRIKIGNKIYETKSNETWRTSIRKMSASTVYDLFERTCIVDGQSTLPADYSVKVLEMELYLQQTSIIEEVSFTMNNYGSVLEQPFKMVYIPIIEGKKYKYDNQEYSLTYEIVMQVVYDLIAKYGGDNGYLLDVQVVPYSPIPSIMSAIDGTFNVNDTSFKQVFIGDNILIPLYSVVYADGQITTNMEISVDDYKQSMKKKYMMTSPSGATSYEFSVAKNGGLEGLIHKYNYRPFASFYQIQPLFKGIYGANYKDTRGLIWQEDTSLTMLSTAWETYKRQNVNYLNSFNAGQNLQRSELAIHQETNWGNYGFDATKRMINASVEAATAAGEATANDLIGIKGAISGGGQATAIMGGAIATEAIEASQLAYNNRQDSKLLETQLSVARTQFNYGIENIKAIPENIEKVSGIYATNNFIAYMQVFEPSEYEKEYYKDYLDTYGCNVGMMVDLSKQTFGYLQGTIIQFGGVITNEEYNELVYQLQRGVREYKE